MKGFNGKILRVDLTRRQFSEETPSEMFYKTYMGGRGFIVHTLLTEVPSKADPLGPENKLIFALGPITGHNFPGSGRNSVGAKSPLTGAYGESEAGGYWGAELKRSGYDALIFEGQSSEPVYLWINNGQAEIRDASHLWGLEVAETQQAIRKELQGGKVRTAAIGPAGENQVRYACILNDVTHAYGRVGLGAVMGSKKLKAIAVKGKALPQVADKEKILELSRWMGHHFKEKTSFWKYGTGAVMDYYETVGNLPINNFWGERFPNIDNISAQSMFNKGFVKRMGSCFGCPVRCKKVVELEKPYRVDAIYGGPEYETLAAFGSCCGIDQIEVIMKANELCNRYGLDTMSAGVTIAFAMECFEKGILTEEDTEGLQLTFGNAQALIEMVKRIAFKKGLGDLLSQGTKKAAETLGGGSEAWAMHVKGEELSMHDPRYKKGLGLHESIHPTGADHATSIHDDAVVKDLTGWDMFGLAENVPSTELSERKVRMIYELGVWRQMGNYLGLCIFLPWSSRQITDVVSFITGWPMSSWKLMKTVERGLALTRIFNLREGFSSKDDTLPKRLISSPEDHPLKGSGVDPEQLLSAQRLYYHMLGWDEKGIPTHARMVELNIEWALKYLPGN